MDSVQTLLTVVVSALTLLLIIVGFQVVMVIVDLRRAIKRLNSILEDGVLGGGLIRPEKLTGIVKMFRQNKKLKEERHGLN